MLFRKKTIVNAQNMDYNIIVFLKHCLTQARTADRSKVPIRQRRATGTPRHGDTMPCDHIGTTKGLFQTYWEGPFFVAKKTKKGGHYG